MMINLSSKQIKNYIKSDLLRLRSGLKLSLRNYHQNDPLLSIIIIIIAVYYK